MALKRTVNFIQRHVLTRKRDHCLLWVRSVISVSTDPEDNNNDHSGPAYSSPKALYEHRITKGELQRDDYQEFILGKLEDLHKQIQDYVPVPPPSKGFFAKLFGGSKPKTQRQKDAAKKFSATAPHGVYLFGSVGCGKTMLMDIFHDSVHIEKKQRIHFHQFMLDVHQRIHEYKKALPRQASRRLSEPYDPILPVAKAISQETWLLCFDEFQVTDIGDAMILKRLFQHLWRLGVVTIATSNRKPDNLYKNGLQRIHFMPFIPMLKANCDVYNLDSGVDYRRRMLPATGKIYFVKSQCDAKYEMDTLYEELVSKEKAAEGRRTLNVLNRDVTFERTCGRILDCTFQEICMRPLGAVDYLEVCKQFDVMILRDVPQLTLERRTEARRFITLVDTLYDHRMKMIISADAEINDIFSHSDQVSNLDRHHHRMLIGDLDIVKGSDNETASLFTGEEELFAFERVMSRLTEMQTEDYWKQRELLKKSRDKQKAKKEKARLEKSTS